MVPSEIFGTGAISQIWRT